MTHYTVYYELNGRKMKTTVEAGSKQHAEELIRSRLIVHSVVEQPFDLFDLLRKKKPQADQIFPNLSKK